MKLSSIELALIAELNLEMARAYEEVARDDRERLESRSAADRRQYLLRERARMLRLEARRASAEPPLAMWLEVGYAGPERRRAERRTGERRVHSPGTADRPAAGYDRRINPDRRRAERRRWPGRV